MKKTFLFFFVFIFIAACSIFAQSQGDTRPDVKAINGFNWSGLTSRDAEDVVTGYFMGVEADLMLHHEHLLFTIDEQVIEEVIQGVNQFYSDSNNLKVPIFVAIAVVALKLANSSPMKQQVLPDINPSNGI